jgi:N6-L-threonylcarbamoyladenine synthase
MDLILGIETSCDETAAAVVADGCEVRSSVVSSQIAQHAPFGGVVPELAAREHLASIEPVTTAALREAGCELRDLAAVAVTAGPGLMPALLIGVSHAKGLALGNGLPLIGVDHVLAHIYGAFLAVDPGVLAAPTTYPLLALVVSGGHSLLVLVRADGTAERIGTTIDDAAGEAFDKVAKLLGLGYPGGPVIERTAQAGNPAEFAFPRGLTPAGGRPVAPEDRFNFSFSGVKTSLLYHCRKQEKERGGEGMSDEMIADTAASFQAAVVDVLCRKTAAAASEYSVATVVLSGGVACNRALREGLRDALPQRISLLVAPPKFCTDNAAMIAGYAWHEFRRGTRHDLGLDAYSRLPALSRVPFVAA